MRIIKVYLRDKNGNQIKETTTSELGLYSEINGGEYQFVDVDLDKLQSGEYYVEFEYCGITYQSVAKIQRISATLSFISFKCSGIFSFNKNMHLFWNNVFYSNDI